MATSKHNKHIHQRRVFIQIEPAVLPPAVKAGVVWRIVAAKVGTAPP